jgi:hypothetical protein
MDCQEGLEAGRIAVMRLALESPQRCDCGSQQVLARAGMCWWCWCVPSWKQGERAGG